MPWTSWRKGKPLLGCQRVMEHPFNITFKPSKWENNTKNGTSLCANNNKRPNNCRMGFGHAKCGFKHHINIAKNESG
jgi:hypothetical protein